MCRAALFDASRSSGVAASVGVIPVDYVDEQRLICIEGMRVDLLFKSRGRTIAILAGCLVVIVAAVLVITAVTGGTAREKGATSGAAASQARSVADFGGLDGLIAAAREEGELNVIALPPDWANYGAIIEAFSDKFGVKVNPLQPDANSQDEINVAQQLKGKPTAPDVFDMGQSVALANTAMFAPY